MQIFLAAGRHGGLLRALALSLVFHVFLLWPAALPWREAMPPVPLIATLRPSSAPVTPAATPDIVPKLLRRKNAEQRPESKPAEVTSATPESDQTQTAHPLTSTATAGDRSEAVQAESPAEASSLPASQGLDADGLRSYRLALAREARSHKRYPARAIEAGWEGTVELRVSVTNPGAPGVQVTRSSGHAMLDDAALDMLRKALPTTPIPPALRSREFSVDLPIVFELPQ